GQANCVMLGALLLGVAAAARGHWNAAACGVALATLIKGYPLALGGILAVLYPRKFAPRFTAVLAGGLLLPFATQPPAVVAGQYASWFKHLADSTVLMRERQRGLDHLLERWGAPIAPATYALLGALAGAAALGLCLW